MQVSLLRGKQPISHTLYLAAVTMGQGFKSLKDCFNCFCSLVFKALHTTFVCLMAIVYANK